MDVLTDAQMDQLTANHTDNARPGTPYYRTPQRDVIDPTDAEVLLTVWCEGEFLGTRAHQDYAVAGLIEAGQLIRSDRGTIKLSEDVQYSLRLLDLEPGRPAC